MSLKSNITILGATGSIGSSTLDVILESTSIDVYALSAYSNVDKLAKLCNQFKPKYAVVPDENKKIKLQNIISSETIILVGDDGLEYISSH